MANLNKMTSREIAEKLGRTKPAITNRCNSLNLKRSAEARERMIEDSHFQKGHKPWNTGMKGIHFSPESEFKPGHKPANTKFDGCVTTRLHKRSGISYKYIRISESKWQLYHRYIWEKHNGPVPPAHIIGFKNGDSLDCRIENLYCMGKNDNVRRNWNGEKASETMKKHWANGDHLKSDNYIAFTLFPRDKELREEVKQHPEIIEMKRMQHKLRRAINETG